ncbi:MAG: hypothetical protein AAF621_00460 [Pseudomonadota bacterium]
MMMTDITAGISYEKTYSGMEFEDISDATLHLRGAAVYNVSLVQGDEGWQLSIPSSLSENWEAGKYFYILVVTRDGDVFEAQSGHIFIKQNPITLGAGADFRTHDEIALENINAVLAGTATFAQKEYRIGNRRLERFEPSELLDVKMRLERRVLAKRNYDRRMASGKSHKIIHNIPIRLDV